MIILKNLSELSLTPYLIDYQIDLLIGGAEEKATAQKLGIGFYDQLELREKILCGFSGVFDVVRDIFTILSSPAWQFQD